MREIVLDTETTGLDPDSGHRIIEIGAIEIHNKVPTGRRYHQYINPQREVGFASVEITGLTNEFLSDKPVFKDIANDFYDFLGDAPLVIHNAGFDMKFINHHFREVKVAEITGPRIIDTITLAKRRLPGGRYSLDALCKRFNIDNTHRTLHGALLDAELLAEVYLELCGGRQHGLLPTPKTQGSVPEESGKTPRIARPRRHFEIPEMESAAHSAFLRKLTDPLWVG